LVPDLIINLDPATPTDPPPTVRLKTAPNTAQAKQVLFDIVDGYNNLLSILNAEIKYDKDVSKRGGLNNNSVARSFLRQMRELTTASVKVSATRSVSLADVGISTNLDGTLSLDQNKLASVMSTRPGVLESVVSSNIVNGSAVKGALERITDMTVVITAPKSSFNTIAKQAESVDLPKIELEVTKLDDAMTALQAKYLKQFSAMQSAVLASQNTQESLSQSMASWSAGLKG
jgi:flagellar hook-associated protein 2